MHPEVQRVTRRVHAAEFKAKVVAQCREPGASVAAVAMANGVNANLVRKWLVGRGVKRAGLVASDPAAPVTVEATVEGGRAAPPPALPAMRFVPVGLAPASSEREPDERLGGSGSASTGTPQIGVELRRGDASVSVRWPASQAHSCTAWLSEVAAAVLGMSRS